MNAVCILFINFKLFVCINRHTPFVVFLQYLMNVTCIIIPTFQHLILQKISLYSLFVLFLPGIPPCTTNN